MAIPAIQVDIVFNQGWNASGTATLTTITTANKVRELFIRRGRPSGQYSQIQAGRCVLVVDNTNGHLDPANTSSPYRSGGSTQVLPGREIQVYATDPSDSTKYKIFAGYVERWTQKYPGHGFDQVTVIEAVDYFKGLANAKCDAGFIDIGGTHGRIIDLIEMASDEVPHTVVGTVTRSTTAKTYTATENVLKEIEKVNDAEVGFVYVDRDLDRGIVIGNREQRIAGASKLIAQFTDDPATDPGWLPYVDAQLHWDDDHIVNKANATMYGSSTTATEATDADSQLANGVRAVDNTALMLATASKLTEWCGYLVDREKDAQTRLDSLIFKPQADEDLWDPLIQADPGQHFQVRRHPTTGSTITVNVVLEGITHRAHADDWKTTLSFSPADLYWVLDTDGTGVYAESSTLGTTTKLAFVDY